MSARDTIAVVGVGALGILAWQFLPPAFGVPRYIIPTFGQTLAELVRMFKSENLLAHFGSTVAMTAVGFCVGSLLGAAGGYALGLSPFWERVLSPYILQYIRRQHALPERRQAKRIAPRRAEQAADAKADGGHRDGRAEMRQQVLAFEHADQLRERLAEGRDDVTRHPERRRQELPGEDAQRPDADDGDGVACAQLPSSALVNVSATGTAVWTMPLST